MRGIEAVLLDRVQSKDACRKEPVCRQLATFMRSSASLIVPIHASHTASNCMAVHANLDKLSLRRKTHLVLAVCLQFETQESVKRLVCSNNFSASMSFSDMASIKSSACCKEVDFTQMVSAQACDAAGQSCLSKQV